MYPIIVAEAGINHLGSMEIIKRMIDLCSELGIPYMKFQKRTIDLVYSEEQLKSYRESPWGTTYRDEKLQLELSLDQYKLIDDYCVEKGIDWFASPWDVLSVEFLVNNFPTMPYIKIPSAKVTDKTFLKVCKESGKPIIMSTGMCTLEMIEDALDIVGDNVHWLLHCTSTYPCREEDLNLLQIQTLKERFGSKYNIGFSNHHPGIIYMVAAVLLGAGMIETHITLGRHLYGSDQGSSIEPEGLRKLVKYFTGLEKAMGTKEKKILESELPVIKKLRG